MSNLPIITTVIPTYRRPTLLRRAIRSALHQTYPSVRVCVYDNASNDETESVVAELTKTDPRVQYYCHPHNIGAYPNFQYGMDQVRTPFFSLLSDDDILLPDFYRVAMAGFDVYPQAVSSLCGAIHVDERGKAWLVQGTDWRSGLYPPPQGLIALLDGKFPPPWTCFVLRREALEVTGPLDESTGNAMDYDFELRLAALSPMVVSSQPGIVFVSHASAESTRMRQKLTWAIWKGSAKLRSKLSDNQQIPEAARQHALSILNGRLNNALFRTFWLKAVMNGDWMLANRAVVIYRVKGYPLRARALAVLQRAIRAIPLGRHAVRLAYRVFVFLNEIKGRQVRRELTNYAPYLEI